MTDHDTLPYTVLTPSAPSTSIPVPIPSYPPLPLAPMELLPGTPLMPATSPRLSGRLRGAVALSRRSKRLDSPGEGGCCTSGEECSAASDRVNGSSPLGVGAAGDFVEGKMTGAAGGKQSH